MVSGKNVGFKPRVWNVEFEFVASSGCSECSTVVFYPDINQLVDCSVTFE